MQSFVVKEYELSNGKSPYRDWINELNIITRARIQARILRFESGNLGVYRSLGAGVYEAKLDFGPGYRVYFAFDSGRIILLLCGGSKRMQSKDIAKAKAYWEDWKE